MARTGWQPWRSGRAPTLPGLGRVIGHRGAAAHAPENTLASIEKAHALGCRWVELDAKLAKDEIPFLLHDATLDRTTSGKGPAAAMDFDDIRRLDAGSWFGPDFAGVHPPSLADTLEHLLKLGMGANIEIKPCPGREALTGRTVANTVVRLWPADATPLLLSSFSDEALVAAREAAPDLPLGLLVEKLPGDWAERMQRLGCTTLHLSHEHVTLSTMDVLVERRVPVLFYTVNDPAWASELFAAGARAVFTDAPDRILPVAPEG